MSINPLKTEIDEVHTQIKDIEARREALRVSLTPIIDQYFTEHILQEKNPELRRDFAYLNASKTFEILDGNVLRFTSRNISGPIKHDVAVSELLSN